MLDRELQALKGYQHTITQYQMSAQKISGKSAMTNGHQNSYPNKVPVSMYQVPSVVQKIQIVNCVGYGGTLKTTSTSEISQTFSFISDLHAWIEQREVGSLTVLHHLCPVY